jgi:hypothetical protein
MSDDRDDMIDAMQNEAELKFGHRLTAKEAAEWFSFHDAESRVQHLKTLKRYDTPLTTHGAKAAAERLLIERALRNTHERLRRIGR